MYNLHYVPTTLGVQSWREIISGGTRTKEVECHWTRRPGNRGSIPGRGRGFFLYPLRPDRLWGHPASYPTGTGGSFPEGKVWREVTLTTHTILSWGQELVGAIPPLPTSASMACSGTALLLLFILNHYLTCIKCPSKDKEQWANWIFHSNGPWES
jgi:hypothetical protein